MRRGLKKNTVALVCAAWKQSSPSPTISAFVAPTSVSYTPIEQQQQQQQQQQQRHHSTAIGSYQYSSNLQIGRSERRRFFSLQTDSTNSNSNKDGDENTSTTSTTTATTTTATQEQEQDQEHTPPQQSTTDINDDDDHNRRSSFASLTALRPALLQAVTQQLGYTSMTEIQQRALPLALAGTDLVGQAKTGSGKTVIFGLALLQALDLSSLDGIRGRPQALVLSPTRELANQLVTSIRSFATRLNGVRVVAVTGGMPSKDQRAKLKRGVHVVVATPGRCLQLLEQGHLDPTKIQTLVMDEADTLLDMGFEEEVNQILEFLPPSSASASSSGEHKKKGSNRQTLLFSATWGERVMQLSQRVQYCPEIVSDGIIRSSQQQQQQQNSDTTTTDGTSSTITQTGTSSAAAAQVDRSLLQQFAVLFSDGGGGGETHTRLAALSHVLATSSEEAVAAGSSCVVFCETRAQCKTVAHFLIGRGASALPLHGDLEQREREKTLVRFRNKSCRILVATNVASRGLDVKDVALVVCYELNQKVDVHVHRVGRTARAEQSGVAVSLVNTATTATAAGGRYRGGGGGGGGGELGRLEAIDAALGGEPIVRKTWTPPLPLPNNNHTISGDTEELRGWAAEWRTVLVLGGRNDKLRPGDVLGAISSPAVGLQGGQVGKIEVTDKYTWIAVQQSVAAQAAEGLGRTKIKKRKFRVHLIE